MENLDIVSSMMESENIPQSIDAEETNQDVVIEQPVVEEGTTDTQTEEVTEEGNEPEKPKANEDELPKGIQKRFAKMTKEKYDMQRELAELRNQVTQMNKKPEVELTREDFGDDENAYIEHKVEQKFKQQQAEYTKANQEKQKEEAQHNQFLNDWQSRIDSFADELPDYAETVSNSTVDLQPDEVQTIMESPIGPKIAYALSANDQLAEQFSNLPSARARDKFITKLEFQLELQAQNGTAPQAPAKNKPVSQAPKPAPKMGGGSSSGNTDPSNMSMDDYIKWRNK